jgi:transposase
VLNSKIHLAVDANGMPVRLFVTDGTTADCRLALPLIRGMTVEMLLADRGYDTDEIINYCKDNGIEAVIPPKKNRVVRRGFDDYIYRLRHLVEDAFLKLKQWRGVATRYAKTTTAFVGAVTVRCLFLWLKVIA